jgi:hypothetical protein
MDIGRNSARAFFALTMVAVLSGACQSNSDARITAPSTPQRTTNGAAGQMPAYYDGQLFTVNMMELSEAASAALIAKNASINKIYASNDLDDPQDFNPVIDAIQGDGFNPLWQQVLIVFNAGFTPHQFVSDEEVLAAAAGPNPEITLVVTDEMYRCSVVGSK